MGRAVAGLRVPLVEAKTLDAVKAYAAKWLELMDARNDDWAKAVGPRATRKDDVGARREGWLLLADARQQHQECRWREI